MVKRSLDLRGPSREKTFGSIKDRVPFSDAMRWSYYNTVVRGKKGGLQHTGEECDSCQIFDCLDKGFDALMAAFPPYKAGGPNSNSFAQQLLIGCDLLYAANFGSFHPGGPVVIRTPPPPPPSTPPWLIPPPTAKDQEAIDRIQDLRFMPPGAVGWTYFNTKDVTKSN
jgi:hypothetical protein